MCIRDSQKILVALSSRDGIPIDCRDGVWFLLPGYDLATVCLLYTSDAADERSSVDLGGRRIIKKKTRGITAMVGHGS